ncbi:MAG: carbon-nitrogen hydrolase family protein [Candidatus Omnitrophota bacterium]
MFKNEIIIIVITLWLIFSVPAFSQKFNPEKYHGQPQSVMKIKIASASFLPVKWEKEKNWRDIEYYVRKAAGEYGADVIVTPEGVLEGYVINEVNREEDAEKKNKLRELFFDLGEPMDGPYIAKTCRLVDELNIFLVFCFLERRDGLLFNTAVLIDPDGDIIGRYSKTHFAQGYEINPDFYRPGSDYPVFDTPFGKAGILICYDRQPPEPARILALKGAQILFLPSYGSYDAGEGWNTALLRTRAYENRFPLIFCHPMQSMLISRHGKVEASGRSGEIVSCEVDLSPDYIKDRFRNRRPETYGEMTEKERLQK